MAIFDQKWPKWPKWGEGQKTPFWGGPPKKGGGPPPKCPPEILGHLGYLIKKKGETYYSTSHPFFWSKETSQKRGFFGHFEPRIREKWPKKGVFSPKIFFLGGFLGVFCPKIAKKSHFCKKITFLRKNSIFC